MSASDITLHSFNYGSGLVLTQIPIEIMTFPGGEEHVKLDPTDLHTRHHLVIDARIADSSGLMRLAVLNDALKRYAHPDTRVSLFLPYLPGARQDRGAPLTARVYADFINSMKFDAVITLDPHSDVMPALLNNLHVIEIDEAFVRTPVPGPSKAVLVIPDAGAGKRVERVASHFGYRTVQALKHRDPTTGQLSGFTCEEVPPEFDDAIIVDDICDGGGTFLGLAPQIHWQSRNQPRLHLWTTHGIYSKGLTFLRPVFRTITSTDSFPVDPEWEKREDTLTRINIRFLLTGRLNSTRWT